MKKFLIGVYNPTIILTYIGVFCAVLGIGVLFSAQATGVFDCLNVVMILLMASGVCDMFDGAVARCFDRTEKEKQFGIQLDSLADTVSFVIYPAVILLSVAEFNILSAIIACFYVFAGIMRLGWFNVTTEENKGFYKGLPVTFSSIVVPLVYLVMKLIDITYLQVAYPVLFACVGLLFILNFKLKKPGMKFLLVMLALAVATIPVLLII